MTEEEEVKPCPFCGSQFLHIESGAWYVWCENCSAEGPAKDTREEAIAAWKHRYNEGRKP